VKRKWLKRILIAAGVLAVISPCLLIIWLFGGRAYIDELGVQMSFHIYPGAEWVSRAQTYECCDSERHLQYYWTPDAVTRVRDYYETFALPFINNMTMFHPYGGELKLGFVPYPIMPEDEINLATDRECHFSQKYRCIQVELVSFGESQEVSLPDVLARDFPNSTPPTPLSDALDGGTLIIYSYYIETDR
jgi:hypothetical protein